MKQLVTLLAVALCLTGCETQKQKQQAMYAESDSLRTVISQKENEINDMMSLLSEIQDEFMKINAAEGRISVARQSGEVNNREVLRENLLEIQQSMQMNKELISTLRQQLKESNLQSSKLKGTLERTIEQYAQQLTEKTEEIAQLQAELAKKDATIAELGEQVTNLNSNVNELNQQNTQKAQTVAQQDKELHTAYYVFGTKKELRQQNILDGSGVMRSGNFSRDYFTKIDYRVTKVVHLYSKSASLMTNHPSGSYSLDKDSKGLYTLRITDPEKFWSVSKYLVIVVK